MHHSKAVNLRLGKRRYEKPSKTWEAVIKDDLDSDWEGIVEILKYKLERVRKRIVGNNVVMDAKQIGREIRSVERLLERVLDKDYHDAAFADFHKKYGKPKMIIIDPTPEEAKNKHVGGRIEFLHRGKVATAAMMREKKKLYEVERKMQQDDLDEALRIIGERLFTWWD